MSAHPFGHDREALVEAVRWPSTPRHAAIAYWRQRRQRPFDIRRLLAVPHAAHQPRPVWDSYERLFPHVTDGLLVSRPFSRPLLFQVLDVAIAAAWPVVDYDQDAVAATMVATAIDVLAPALLCFEITSPQGSWCAETSVPVALWLSRQPPCATLAVRARPYPDRFLIDLVGQQLLADHPCELADRVRRQHEARSPPTLYALDLDTAPVDQ